MSKSVRCMVQGDTSRSWSSKRSLADGKWTSVSGSTLKLPRKVWLLALGFPVDILNRSALGQKLHRSALSFAYLAFLLADGPCWLATLDIALSASILFVAFSRNPGPNKQCRWAFNLSLGRLAQQGCSSEQGRHIAPNTEGLCAFLKSNIFGEKKGGLVQNKSQVKIVGKGRLFKKGVVIPGPVTYTDTSLIVLPSASHLFFDVVIHLGEC